MNFMPPRDTLTTPTLDPVEDISRRGLLVTPLAAALFAACRSDNGSDRAQPDAEQSAQPYPRTVQTPDGPLTLMKRPSKVVATSSNSIMFDHLLALGVVPAFATTGVLMPWQTALGADRAKNIPNNAQPDVEAFAAEGVDLIAFTDIPVMRQRSAAYRNIAPYLFVHNNDIEANLRTLGEVFAEEEKAATLIREYESAVASWMPAWEPASVTVMYAGSPGQVFVYGPEASMAPLLEQVLTPLTERNLGNPGGFVSYERLASVDADLVLVIDPYPGEVRATADGFFANPVLQSLESARRGRFVRLDEQTSFALLVPSALSIPIALKGLGAVLERTKGS